MGALSEGSARAEPLIVQAVKMMLAKVTPQAQESAGLFRKPIAVVGAHWHRGAHEPPEEGPGAGPAINPRKKGLRMRGAPLKGQPCDVLILDTEGMGGNDGNESRLIGREKLNDYVQQDQRHRCNRQIKVKAAFAKIEGRNNRINPNGLVLPLTLTKTLRIYQMGKPPLPRNRLEKVGSGRAKN